MYNLTQDNPNHVEKLSTNLISKATIQNWNRLNFDDKNKLQNRANKRASNKNIIPNELINKEYLKQIILIIDYIKQNNISLKNAIYELGINLLKQNSIKREIESINDDFLQNVVLPSQPDILGAIYQILQKEGNKNIKGSYYTPVSLIELKYNQGDKILDPCCGSGSFLLSYNIDNPLNLCGIDIDPIACFIAKINLILKYKHIDFEPNIICADFLEMRELNKFDVIATNPPWGAMLTKKYDLKNIKSGESFSYFIVKATEFLKNNGTMSFILPISILNVAVHKDIRQFLLERFNIEIKQLGRCFSGVFTEVIELTLTKKTKESPYNNNVNYNFTLTSEQDNKLLEKIYNREYLTLKNSTWGLGIVVGNNKKFIGSKGSEKIWTGKEIAHFEIKNTTNYIDYKREQFQQVAPESIYRAKEKLVYKFIAKRPVFALDIEQRLFLNSANILIPTIENYTIKTIMYFLNSQLFYYIYKKKFNEIKILKGNLLQLPFPIIDKGINEIINENNYNEMVENLFGLNEKEKEIIWNI